MGQKPISKICIPKGVVESFLPCESLSTDDGDEEDTKCKEQVKNRGTYSNYNGYWFLCIVPLQLGP